MYSSMGRDPRESGAAVLIRPGRKDVDPKERAVWGDLMALGMVFPIAIALGFFIGRWVGGLLGHPKAGLLVGLVWGVATGFWELYKTTVRLNRLDPEAGADGNPGQDAGTGSRRSQGRPDGDRKAQDAPVPKDGPDGGQGPAGGEDPEDGDGHGR
jgi:hypothetical protein